MNQIKSGKDKQLVYKTEYKQLKTAIKYEFFLEAISIEYAIIEDRLVAFLHYAGIISRNNGELRINKSVYPYIRLLLKKDEKAIIKVKDISVKMDIIRALINLTKNEASDIDSEVDKYKKSLNSKRFIVKTGYMQDLQSRVSSLNLNEIVNTLDQLDIWRQCRNQLIHALMSKSIVSSNEARKECSEIGYLLARDIDNVLVKPFKLNNKLRIKYRIQ